MAGIPRFVTAVQGLLLASISAESFTLYVIPL